MVHLLCEFEAHDCGWEDLHVKATPACTGAGDSGPLKLLNIVDECTREALAMDVERSIDADLVVATLDRNRGAARLPDVFAFRSRPGVHRERFDTLLEAE